MASACFDPLIPHLKDDFRLIIPDLPGFGNSFARGLKDVSIKAHAGHLSALIEKLKLTGVTAVGYSMGGGVALHLEEIQPERIDRAILLSSIGVQEHELLGDYLLNHVIHGLQLSVITGAQELIPHFGILDRFMLNRNYARNFFETDQRPLRGLLERWDKPLQIIHGDSDRLVPASAAVEHHRIVPQSRIDWIENAGHIALIRQPDVVARFISEGQSYGAESSADRIIASNLPMVPNRIDKTLNGKIAVGSLLALSTFASEDLSCISGGLLVARNVATFWTATIGCLIGIFLSDIGLFFVGRWCTGWVSRFSFLKSKIESFNTSTRREWLEKNAGKLIVVSRFIPGSRVPTYVARVPVVSL